MTIRLPRGGTASFALAESGWRPDEATAAVVKDAGDDPDVTHGCLVRVTVAAAPAGSRRRVPGRRGVGTVTRPGLPIAPGEPAINPGAAADDQQRHRWSCERPEAGWRPALTVAIPGGEMLAARR